MEKPHQPFPPVPYPCLYLGNVPKNEALGLGGCASQPGHNQRGGHSCPQELEGVECWGTENLPLLPSSPLLFSALQVQSATKAGELRVGFCEAKSLPRALNSIPRTTQRKLCPSK